MRYREIVEEFQSLNRGMGQLRDELRKELSRMTAVMDALVAAVSKEDTEIDSAIALLQGITKQLQDALASNDPAAVQKVVDDITAKTQTLADAVVANTPAAT